MVQKEQKNQSEHDRLLEQERLILDVTERIYELMEKEGVNSTELAKRLGRTKGFVSQVLNGRRNMTLRTLSDFLGALSHRARISTRPATETFQDAHEDERLTKVMAVTAGALAALIAVYQEKVARRDDVKYTPHLALVDAPRDPREKENAADVPISLAA